MFFSLCTDFYFGLAIGMQWLQVDGAKTSAAAPEISGGGGGGKNNSSSSEEEEWRDEGMDFTKRASLKDKKSTKVKAKGASSSRSNAKPDGRRRKVDNKATRAAAVPAVRGTRSSARDKTRAAAAAAAAEAAATYDDAAAKYDDWLSSASDSKRSEGPDSGDDMDALDESEDDEDVAERLPTPPPLLSPGGVYDGGASWLFFGVHSCGGKTVPGKSEGRLVITGPSGVGK